MSISLVVRDETNEAGRLYGVGQGGPGVSTMRKPMA